MTKKKSKILGSRTLGKRKCYREKETIQTLKLGQERIKIMKVAIQTRI